MSFSEKNKHTRTNTDTMSPFLIFLIVVTLGYVIYYAAIITIDMNAKPKDAVSSGETMETPDGMQATEDNDNSEEETTSREADVENDDDTSGHSDEETDEDHQDEEYNHGTDRNDLPPTEPHYAQESQSSYTGPSPEDDDDVYGIDRQMNEETEHHRDESIPSAEAEAPSPSKEQFPSNQEDSPEVESDNEESDTDRETTFNEDGETNTDDEDEEDIEVLKEQALQHLAQVAQAEGAEIVEAEVHDDSEFEEKAKEVPMTLIDKYNYDTGWADEINESNEQIITESTLPIRQDLFAPNVLGAFNRMKKEQESTPEPPAVNPDNIEKKEHITKA